ncbi:ATP-dependent helicase HrpB [Polymorphobacter fuscus]|uniref:ATP-dependent helicase HrpB n=1 Tax=Sandarakinorhabdus fusca TaxID=1439888 RepID=A0A7C9GMS0_9SPHN|nr:ATP-dependent helicase HrpB [Polymorphobacter fuscus]KAB7648265.1 ATP-dependent helicase HrpB [Polymorphobacter fuscus]MQT15773.1 ATP-dependent helicase HrpB [Polymorphobacter fuscus]NJC07955.1 ATP-dependent helicase HrpB [Polymorphobacter fuscus]
MPLPVEDILPALLAALAANAPVALVAPPGAGKTTAVAPALLDQGWATGGRILLLSPRRLAARAAAERMAANAGEAVGDTIGYRTRLDSRISARTRIEVVTQGIYTRMVASDPELPGVAAVLFDEVHERSLESDLALALTLDARDALRPDLRLLLMSATLDGAAYDAIIPGLARIASEGRMFPVGLRHIGRDAAVRIEDAVASAVRAALADEPGSVLAFLPGAAEIERTAERLVDRLPADVDLHRLYGAREGEDQRAAIRPAPPGRRKAVLATSIAETSITIDGVRVVVDSGLARRPRHDRAVGLTRLVTERASQAAVTQRAGRAGRTAPGIAVRLWEAGETAGRPRFDPPEILDSDLSGLVLECARSGVTDPRSLRWLDPPPPAALDEARSRLLAIGALTADGRPTPHGERIAALPLPPVLGHMLVAAGARGHAALAARIAAIITERGLGGRSTDLDDRLRLLARDRGPRADAARRLAERWARAAGGGPATEAASAAEILALAFPDRVARRRGGPGAPWLMANGRAVAAGADDPLTAAAWIVVADATGTAAGARLLLGAALDPASVETLFADRVIATTVLAFDPATGSVTAETTRRLGAITLARAPIDRPDPAAVAAALLGGVRDHGVAQLPWGPASVRLRARAAFARAHGADLPDLSDAALRADIDWLAPLLAGRRRLDAIPDAALAEALRSHIGWAALRALGDFAPEDFATPAGSHHAIDYAADGGPAVDVRVQALFGLGAHPMVAAGRVPLTLRLTSPAGRPIQVTTDLPRFWTGSWADVRRDLRGRYPRHPWPEDPAAAAPTLRAKRPGQAG